jgi:hypothetical protein
MISWALGAPDQQDLDPLVGGDAEDACDRGSSGLRIIDALDLPRPQLTG